MLSLAQPARGNPIDGDFARDFRAIAGDLLNAHAAGTVRSVRPGAVNAEVTVESAGGLPVVAIVTQGSVEALGLQPGQPVTVLVKASDVILATIG